MSSAYLYVPSRTARGGLTATELVYARMPFYHGRHSDLTNPGELPDACVVCGDSLGDDSCYRQLPCSHIFHQPCIDTWLRTQDASCPVCRRTFYYLRMPRLVRVVSPSTGSPTSSSKKSHLKLVISWLGRRIAKGKIDY